MKEDFELFNITYRTDLVVSLSNFVTHDEKFDEILVETKQWAETDKYIFPKFIRENPGAMNRKVEHSACIKWISDAGQHIVRAHIHESLPENIQTKAGFLQARCYQWMYPKSNKPVLKREDLDWAISEARHLLRCLEKHYESNSNES